MNPPLPPGTFTSRLPVRCHGLLKICICCMSNFTYSLLPSIQGLVRFSRPSLTIDNVEDSGEGVYPTTFREVRRRLQAAPRRCRTSCQGFHQPRHNHHHPGRSEVYQPTCRPPAFATTFTEPTSSSPEATDTRSGGEKRIPGAQGHPQLSR